ncbi:MAG: T9SS type A sorting domain-containing protein [Bacteroidia bacterium]|nr:T9SS type A sorting domain-containing protein [Bacteroidia bacterium]
MKKIILPLFVFFTLRLFAQTSTELGDGNEFKQFIPEKARMGRGTVMAFDSQNNLYFAYHEIVQPPLDWGGPLHVLKKTGNSFQEVGNLSSWGEHVSRPIICFDNFDTLYIAFYDPGQITVLKFNGSNWVSVGSPRTLGDYTMNDQIHLVFDKNNTPYLSGYQNTGIGVQKFDGNSWVNIYTATPKLNVYGGANSKYSLMASANDTGVYLAAFIPSLPTPTTPCVLRYSPVLNKWDTVGEGRIADSISHWQLGLLFNSQKKLFLGSISSDYKLYLYQFNGTGWTEIIGARSAFHNTEFPTFLFDQHDSLYLKAHHNNGLNNLLKFTGTGWRHIGTNEIATYDAAGSRGILDKNGIPYIALMENSTEKLEIRTLINDTQWVTVGSNVSGTLGINGRAVQDPIVTINPKTGLPFMMYAEKDNARATISFWNAGLGKWTAQGAEGFTSPELYHTVAIDTSGKTFCAFIDYNGMITAKDFNGNNWVNTGSPDITSGAEARYSSMAITPNGTPYLAYSVSDGTKSKAQVKKYNGSSWQTVGGAYLSLGNASYTHLAISPSGTPFLIFCDDSLGGQAIVKKFDGTNWVNVGGASLGTEKAKFTSIAIDAHDTVYALFTNPDNGRMVVKKNSGSLWSLVGSQFNDSLDGGGSIGLDLANFPYVTYPDPAFEHKASIKWFNGTAWNYLGPPGFSAGRAAKPVLTFDKNNNLYVAYTTGQAFARKFSNLITGVQTATITRNPVNNIFPNPVAPGGTLHLDIRPQDIGKTYTIYDLQGKIKYSGKLLFENNELNPDLFTKGIYLLRIDGCSAAYKLVVQE